MKNLFLIIATFLASTTMAFAVEDAEPRDGVSYIYEGSTLIGFGIYKNNTLRSKVIYGDTKSSYVETNYSFSGSIVSKISYENGEKNGWEKIYDPNHTLRSSVYYVDGQEYGDKCFYNEKGEKYRTDSYDNGKIVASTSLFAALRRGVERIAD